MYSQLQEKLRQEGHRFKASVAPDPHYLRQTPWGQGCSVQSEVEHLPGNPLQSWMHSLLKGQCIVFLLLKFYTNSLQFTYSYKLIQTSRKWTKCSNAPPGCKPTLCKSTLRCFHATRDWNMSTGEHTAITTCTLQDLLAPFNCWILIPIPNLLYSWKYGTAEVRSPFTALLKTNRSQTGRSQIPACKH